MVEFRVMPENAGFVERNPPVRRKVAGDVRPVAHGVAQGGQCWIFGRETLHRARKSVVQPFDHMEQGQVDIAQGVADQPAIAVLQDLGEMVEEFRDALLDRKSVV